MKQRFKPNTFCSKSLSIPRFFLRRAYVMQMIVIRFPDDPKTPIDMLTDAMKYRNEFTDVLFQFCKNPSDESRKKPSETNVSMFDMTKFVAEKSLEPKYCFKKFECLYITYSVY